MSETQPNNLSQNKTRSRKLPQRHFPAHDKSINSSTDSANYLYRYAVPLLADTFGADSRDLRGLVGIVGSTTRSAKVYEEGKPGYASHEVFAERSVETNERGKRVGLIALRLTICRYQPLDEAEIVAQWPIIKEVGAADELRTSAIAHHTMHTYTDDDIDLDDFLLNAEVMRGQLDTLIGTDEDDEKENLSTLMYRQEIGSFYEKSLQLVTGMRPSLTVSTGYETDTTKYPLEIGESFATALPGDTPAELALLSQLRRESSSTIDSEIVREFDESLALTGIIKRRRKKSR